MLPHDYPVRYGRTDWLPEPGRVPQAHQQASFDQQPCAPFAGWRPCLSAAGLQEIYATTSEILHSVESRLYFKQPATQSSNSVARMSWRVRKHVVDVHCVNQSNQTNIGCYKAARAARTDSSTCGCASRLERVSADKNSSPPSTSARAYWQRSQRQTKKKFVHR
jgi:hypothetical protein